MTWQYKQELTADNLNDAFISRKGETNVIGKINLKRTDTESGDHITNLQKFLNELPFGRFNELDEVVLDDNESLALPEFEGMILIPVKGLNDISRNLSLTPFGNVKNWRDGAQVTLLGTNNTGSIRLQFQDVDYGAVINGNAVLKRFYAIQLLYSKTLKRWIEIGRNF